LNTVEPPSSILNKKYDNLPSPEIEEPMSGRRKRVLLTACVCILGK
jgi:hypothetical protein